MSNTKKQKIVKIGSEKPRECIRKLKKNGFKLQRIKGSHQFFYRRKEGRSCLVLVALHTKELGKDSVKNIIRQAGKDKQEWVEI